MRVNKWIAAALALCLVLSCLPATTVFAAQYANTMIFSKDGVAYLYDSDGRLSNTYTGWMTKAYEWEEGAGAMIPGTPWWYDVYSVTDVIIEDGVAPVSTALWFAQGFGSLSSVTIGNGITALGESMFESCWSLSSITIPDSVTSIGDSAFAWCENLTEITLPDSVTSIGNRAFISCWELTGIIIPNSVISIGEGAFSGCESLTEINIPDSVTNIGDYAFAYCDGLTELTIPGSVITIGDSAFNYCKGLTEISFTGKAPTIGADAFYGVRATAYYPAGDASWTADVMQDYGGTITWVPGGACANGHNYVNGICTVCGQTDATVTAYGTCGENLTWILNTNGVLTISGTGAMTEKPWSYWSSEINTVVIENGVTTICDSAFAYNYNKLTKVTIPDSVTTIGKSAFYWCTALSSITLPKGLTSIGTYAFTFCRNLTSITIPDGVTAIGDHAFGSCNSLRSINIPASVVTIGEGVFGSCSALNGIWVDAGNSNYSSDASGVLFDKNKTTLIQAPGCISGRYTVPGTVTTIVEQAFYFCTGLTGITIPEGVTDIGDRAFYQCTGLTSVSIPEGVTTICDSTFSYCTGLTSVSIPESVTSIGYGAFSNCENLRNVSIPDSVTELGANAFGNCDALSFYQYGNAYYLGNSGNPYHALLSAVDEGIGSCTIHEDTRLIADNAFEWCYNITMFTIPEDVVTIGDYAFAGCESLKEVTFMGNAPSIGQNAFEIITGGDPWDQYLVTVTAYYPAGNKTWTEEARQNYGGDIIWVPYGMPSCDNGHSYEAVVTAPTCTEQGYTTYTCTVCGESYVGDYTDPAHEFVDGVCVVCGCIDWPQGGTCGDNLTWTLDENGVLTISGTGDMWEYSWTYWYIYRDSIFEVVIEEGVTSISYCAFEYCEGLTSITIPSSITYLGDYAFSLSGLQTITFEGDAPSFGKYVFEGTSATVYYPEDNATWTEAVMQNYGGDLTWKPSSEDQPELGDVNGDGKIDTTDAKLIMQYDLGLVDESALNLSAADVNGDGKIDTTDAKLIMQLDLGLISEFPKP